MMKSTAIACLAAWTVLGAGCADGTAIATGNRHPPALAANVMNSRIEGTTRTERRLSGQRTANHGGCEQIFGFKQAAQSKCGGGLRTVQQRQPLFRRQRDWRKASIFQRFTRR